ncbi:MAG: hypothetical protein M0Q93_04100 [Terrimicrobiaceae bacterium]|nr:hypothetical protein [Terrimicrobiaceae bacterium]
MKTFIKIFSFIIAANSVYSNQELFNNLLADSPKERKAAANAILSNPENVSLSDMPFFLDALDKMGDQDEKKTELLIAVTLASQNLIYSKDQHAITNAPAELKRRFLDTFKHFASSENPRNKEYSYVLIGMYSSNSPAAEEYLNERFLKEASNKNKSLVIKGLGYSGIHTKESAAIIVSSLRADDQAIALEAAEAAARARFKEALPIVVSNLLSSNPTLQNISLNSLIRYDYDAKPVIDQIKNVAAQLPQGSAVRARLETIISYLLSH